MKKTLSIMLIMLLMFNVIPAYAEAKISFWSATDEDAPELKDGYYEIRTAENLAWISDLSRFGHSQYSMNNVRLMNDIDLGGKKWTPIKDFKYDFDGQNCTISNLLIDTTFSKQGLFERLTNNAVVYNLHLENVNIKGGDSTGAIAGSNIGQVRNCSVTGMVQGGNYVGGIVGFNDRAFNGYTGETVYTGLVENCISYADVSGESFIGGVVGANSSNEIHTSGSFGKVSGKDYVGGVAGSGRCVNSFSRGDVYNTATIEDGISYENIGYTGTISGSGDLTNCYSTGKIIYALTDEQLANVTRTNPMTGGHVQFDETVENSYYNSDTTGYNQAVTEPGVYAKTTAEMKSDEMLTLLNKNSSSPWTFKDGVNNDYPVFYWQYDIVEIPDDITPATVEAKRIGRGFDADGLMVELDLGDDNGKKIVRVGEDELYYSIERNLYVGIVKVSNIDGTTISNVYITDGKPEPVVYGNIDCSKVDEANPQACIGNGDILCLKLYHMGRKEFSNKAYVALDLMGRGVVTNQLLWMKLHITKGSQFPILNQ